MDIAEWCNSVPLCRSPGHSQQNLRIRPQRILKSRAPNPKCSKTTKSRPRKDRRGFDLISDALPFGRLWYSEPDAISNAIGYAKFYSRSHAAVIRVYDSAGNVIEMHEQRDEVKEQYRFCWGSPHSIPFPACCCWGSLL